MARRLPAVRRWRGSIPCHARRWGVLSGVPARWARRHAPRRTVADGVPGALRTRARALARPARNQSPVRSPARSASIAPTAPGEREAAQFAPCPCPYPWFPRPESGACGAPMGALGACRCERGARLPGPALRMAPARHRPRPAGWTPACAYPAMPPPIAPAPAWITTGPEPVAAKIAAAWRIPAVPPVA